MNCKIKLIVAMSDNYIIGNNNKLLWDIKEDMKLFNFFRKINHSPSLSSAVNLNEDVDVGRNAPHLRTPPLLCGTAQDFSAQRFGCTWQYATAQGGRSAFCSVRGWGRVLQFCVIIFLLFLPLPLAAFYWPRACLPLPISTTA